MSESPKSAVASGVKIGIDSNEIGSKDLLKHSQTMKNNKEEPVKRLYGGGSAHGDFKTSETFNNVTRTESKGVSEMDKFNRNIDLSDIDCTEQSFVLNCDDTGTDRSGKTERSDMYKNLKELQKLNEEILKQNQELIKKNQALVAQIGKDNNTESSNHLEILSGADKDLQDNNIYLIGESAKLNNMLENCEESSECFKEAMQVYSKDLNRMKLRLRQSALRTKRI